jgi:uncharacterized protein (TIGR02001 family)
MKKQLIALAAVATLAGGLPTASYADMAYNIGVASDYRYRGISQSRLKPALQGGADYSNGPVYFGTWASTIDWIKDAGTIAGVDTGSANLEVDLYGGYKGEISKDLTYDIGGLYYWYPSNKYNNIPGSSKADTFEIYGALTFGVFTAKYSHSLTNLFGAGGSGGAPDSKGSGYLDLSANFDLGDGYTLTPHYGHQGVHNYGAASYNDYSLTLGKDFGAGVSGTVAVVGTDADKSLYFTPEGKFTGKNALVLGVKFTF